MSKRGYWMNRIVIGRGSGTLSFLPETSPAAAQASEANDKSSFAPTQYWLKTKEYSGNVGQN